MGPLSGVLTIFHGRVTISSAAAIWRRRPAETGDPTRYTVYIDGGPTRGCRYGKELARD